MNLNNFKIYTKKELKRLNKNQIIELFLEQQDFILQLLNSQNQLDKRLKDIEEKVNEPKKTSKNSSLSSSMDLTRNKVENKTGKKRGPKYGHKGTSRKLKENADKQILCLINKNPRTGKEMTSKSNSFSNHQIIEIESVINFEIINIKRQITTGEDGKTITAPNPPWVKDNKSFGPKFEALISTMRYRYNIPWNKIREFILTFTNEKISSGLLSRIFQDVKKTLKKDYDKIKDTIRQSEVVGADETGEHIEGDKGWGWVFRTESATYYTITKTRSSKVPRAILGKDFDGILVSDFWGAYNEKLFTSKKYQKCLCHLDRDFKFVIEIEKVKGISKIGKIRQIFFEAIELKKDFDFESNDFKIKREGLEKRLDLELTQEDFGTKSGNRLRRRLIKYREHLLTFLYFNNVPFHNNGSERDIRKFVGLRKVSGSFRSIVSRGPLWQSVIMSVIETARKNDVNYFEYIYQRLSNISEMSLWKI
jgi:transposase